MAEQAKVKRTTPKTFRDGAPNPGYDREPVKPERLAYQGEVYPKPFVTSLKGQGTINTNARKQMEKSEEYGQ